MGEQAGAGGGLLGIQGLGGVYVGVPEWSWGARGGSGQTLGVEPTQLAAGWNVGRVGGDLPVWGYTGISGQAMERVILEY